MIGIYEINSSENLEFNANVLFKLYESLKSDIKTLRDDFDKCFGNRLVDSKQSFIR